jgi:hypothetical protein
MGKKEQPIMELEQIKILRTDLEKSITNMVRSFEVTTGTFVSNINHRNETINKMGSEPKRFTSTVTVDVEV